MDVGWVEERRHGAASGRVTQRLSLFTFRKIIWVIYIYLFILICQKINTLVGALAMPCPLEYMYVSPTLFKLVLY